MTDRCPLIGRGKELRVIADALGADDCRGVLMVGDAGVGKTRLAEEAAAAAEALGWLVHRVTASVTAQSIELGAFTKWSSGSHEDPHNAAHHVVATMTDAGASGRILISIDDAHLLDNLSAFVVYSVLQRPRVKVLITARSGALAPDAVMKPWKEGILHRVDLPPLSQSESEDLLRSALLGQVSGDCAEQLWELTRGNPAYLTQIIGEERAAGNLVEDDGMWSLRAAPTVSPSLRDVVQMQFGALAESVQEVVDLVAVAGSIGRSLLNSLADLEASAEAERLGLIRADESTPDVIRVAHPLYSAIRLAQCGRLRQSRLRGRLATAMASPHNTAPVDPAQLGLLWLESDLPPDAGILKDAAESALALLDIEFAERCARAAVDAGGGVGPKLQHAYCLFLLGRSSEAHAELSRIRPDELRGNDFLNEFNLMVMNLQFGFAQPDEALRLIEGAQKGSTGMRAQELNLLRGFHLGFAADPVGAIDALQLVDPDQFDSFGAVVCLGIRTLAHGERGQLSKLRQEAARGWRVFDDQPDAFMVANLAKLQTHVLVLAGDIAGAAEVAQHAYRRCARSAPVARTLCSATIGLVALAAGDLAVARRRLHPGQVELGQFGVITGHTYRYQVHYTTALARSGNVEDAVQALERAADVRRPHLLYVEAIYLLAQAWVAAAQGQIERARDISAQAATFARRHGQLATEVLCLQTSVQFCDATVAERLAELATLVEGPRAPIAARYAKALADDAAAELEAVAEDFEAMGDLLAAADAAAHASSAYRVADRRGSALTAGARAESLAKRCGRATSPALAGAKIAFPFSHRQREIALLVSRGLTNREIAEVLSLSVRTVEGHIYRATFKAGIATRAELAKVVQEFDH
ncbi:LuxR C-terminal-related transcriptional regulator [Mycobacterium simulans]|uniref:LuxR C-terminal-related transcriptional regulator n=1 Tax=Mycobacterium simulans TaxID=627089 RepID=UPI00174D5A14|nr:helix-turn-helix transcriptional regulator [Mycobacterium simulans]